MQAASRSPQHHWLRHREPSQNYCRHAAAESSQRASRMPLLQPSPLLALAGPKAVRRPHASTPIPMPRRKPFCEDAAPLAPLPSRPSLTPHLNVTMQGPEQSGRLDSVDATSGPMTKVPGRTLPPAGWREPLATPVRRGAGHLANTTDGEPNKRPRMAHTRESTLVLFGLPPPRLDRARAP